MELYGSMNYTIVDVLKFRALEQKDKIALTFLSDGEDIEEKITYSQLEQKAKCVATKLLKFCNKGDRVLLVLDSGIDYVAAFFGCVYAGMIAIPTCPPKQDEPIDRLENVCKDSGAKTALASKEMIVAIKPFMEDTVYLNKLSWTSTDEFCDIDIDKYKYPEFNEDSLAFIQYTSGSTGNPKGVMVSHYNIIELFKNDLSPIECYVGWLPMYYNAGLILGILRNIFTGTSCIFMPPVAFLQKPVRWLKAVSKYKATFSGAANFAYDLCVQKIADDQCKGLDLSTWDSAFIAGEAIRNQTLENFYNKFKKYGFRKEAFCTVYGLAEATLSVSGGPKVVQNFNATKLEDRKVEIANLYDEYRKEIVAAGEIMGDYIVEIVDPDTLLTCKPYSVGEIWVKSKTVAKGYWGKKENTENTFNAYITDSGEGPFLRTGDLGFMLDKNLYIVGRLKDMIIINGKKYYPDDIEKTVWNCSSAIPSSSTAAFSVDIESQERLVIVCEIDESCVKSEDFSKIAKELRTKVLTGYGIDVYEIVLIKASSIDRTAAGIIQHFLVKKKYLDNSLDKVYLWNTIRESNRVKNTNFEIKESDKNIKQKANISKNELESWFVCKIAEITGLDKDSIDVREPFYNLGIDSVKMVNVSGELETFLRIKIPPTLLYNYPTISDLSAYLSMEYENSKSTEKAIENNTENNTYINFAQRNVEDPIAIVGMACRFPGADNLEEYRDLICNKKDAVEKVPKDRWDVDKYYDADKSAPGKISTSWGGFINDIDKFDPTFFGISPKEASYMDPQQRLLLEMAWNAMENAGINKDEIKGSKTGVFMGSTQCEYNNFLSDITAINNYSATGTSLGLLANRISYCFDFKGPSITIDTICSSSLISVHLACQSIKNGECELALAGGSNLITTPTTSLVLTRLNLLCNDGRCKVFDSEANGIVRSEGVAVIVLKKLSKAIADNDRIYAVISGSAVNQDGKTSGITAPNGVSQYELYKNAYERANIKPSEVDYVETHGTGTVLGDPIEANSLGKFASQGRPEDKPCYIGSVKSNIGHAESIGGVASLIKVALSIKNRLLPPNIHFNNPNPHIEFEKYNLKVPQDLIPWPYDKPAVGGVSSFAFGGTNCHVVLTEFGYGIKKEKAVEKLTSHMLLLSAPTKDALADKVKVYSKFIESNNEDELYNICYTTNVRRTHFDYRLAIIFFSKEDLINKLHKVQRNQHDSEVYLGLKSQQLHIKTMLESYESYNYYTNNKHVLTELAKLYTQGYEIDWAKIYSPKCEIVNVPYYPFQKKAYWFERNGQKVTYDYLQSIKGSYSINNDRISPTHPSLDRYLNPAHDQKTHIWELNLCTERFPYLRDHRVFNTVVVPTAFMVETVLGGAKNAFGEDKVHEITLDIMLGIFLPEGKIVPTQLVIKETSKECESTFKLLTKATDKWSLNAQGKIKSCESTCKLETLDFDKLLKKFPEQRYGKEHYDSLLEKKMEWRDSFKGLVTFWSDNNEVLGKVELPSMLNVDYDHYNMHPALLDSAFQVPNNAMPKALSKLVKDPSLLVHLESFKLYKKCPKEFYSYGVIEGFDSKKGQVKGSIKCFDNKGNIFAELSGIVLQRLGTDRGTSQQTELTNNDLYELIWEEKTINIQTSVVDKKSWLIFAADSEICNSFVTGLQNRGENVILVYQGSKFKEDRGTYYVRSGNKSDLNELVLSLTKANKNAVNAMVHLWNTDYETSDETDLSMVKKADDAGFVTLANFIQALKEKKFNNKLNIWIVTKDAVSPEGKNTNITQANLWGFVDSFALEHPELWGGIIDIGKTNSSDQASKMLIDAILSNTCDKKLSIYDNKYYVQRIVPVAIDEKKSKDISIDINGMYLVTGGLGAIGLNVVNWLVSKGAKHITIATRRNIGKYDKTVVDQINFLEKNGVAIRVVKMDVFFHCSSSRTAKAVIQQLIPLWTRWQSIGDASD